MTQRVSLRIGDEELVLETGRMAKQANGAVFARVGGSAVIATACCAEQPRAEDIDFVPLSVDYIEKYYAAGKIPGGFIKRETRPKDKEILVSRFIDRPLRPLFSKTFKREIQVVPIVIATDLVNMPDIIAMNAASAAVTISDIPFAGPVGAVRVAWVDGQLVVNPSFDQVKASQLDLVVAGTDGRHHDGRGRRPPGVRERRDRGDRASPTASSAICAGSRTSCARWPASPRSPCRPPRRPSPARPTCAAR